MTTKEFFLKWNGIGLDADGAYGFQCVDVFKQFNKDVIGGPAVNGNAVDYWTNYPTAYYDKVANTPDGVPSEGDVLIWGTGLGQYGHIAICFVADVNHFVSFDQNFPIGSVCHFQSHNYSNLLGWLHPKSLPLAVPAITDQTKLPIIDENGNQMEVQAVRSRLTDWGNKIANQIIEIANLKSTLDSLNSQITVLQSQISNLPANTAQALLNAIHDVLYGPGFWWTKWTKIKTLLPK